MKEVETPDAAPICDGVAVETGGEQLRHCDRAMLPSGRSGDQNVGVC